MNLDPLDKPSWWYALFLLAVFSLGMVAAWSWAAAHVSNECNAFILANTTYCRDNNIIAPECPPGSRSYLDYHDWLNQIKQNITY